MGSPGPSQGGRKRPHIRLNSGTQDVLASRYSPALPSPLSPSRPGASSPSRPATSRSLLSPTSPANPHKALYSHAGASASGSTELLLPPRRLGRRGRRFRDDDYSPVRSPAGGSAASSRRSSWSSESAGSRDSRFGGGLAGGPFASPFDDGSRPASREGSDPDGDDGGGSALNTQTVSEKYIILPSAGLLLFPEDVEKDDWLHNPDPSDRERGECDVFSRRGLVNVGGLALITLGILALFIGYPILTFLRRKIDPTMGACSRNPDCIDSPNVPVLKNLRTDLIDPDTPDSVKTRKSKTGKTQVLVYSDEFNKAGRTFYEGDDPYWTAVDIWYGVTQDLEWYDPDAATTEDGVLAIKFDAFKNHNLNYRSAMLQSWNQLCFKGGHMEASISLPGRGDTIGFWPGFWSMGNLGRPGYAATTDGMWPYSYHDECDAGITKNQSQPDGLSYLPGMKLPACTCGGEDHPGAGRSRSAPEIDALEASVMYLDPPDKAAIGQVSQSCQIAPFDVFYQPNYDFVEVYDRSVTSMNSYQGGVYQQAVSGLTNLNNAWYDGRAYQTYSFEYEPGPDGYVTWHVGGAETWTLDARALGPNGNIGQRTIPQEPMAMIVNFGMSNGFAALNLTGLAPLMPATMRVDYVRLYQDEGEELVTCDPPGYETTRYIAEHPGPYTNPNLTMWEDAGYDWPLNSLVDGCEAEDRRKTRRA